MKVLVFGANGQVGQALVQQLSGAAQVLALHRHSSQACGDLQNLQGIAQTVRDWRPEVILNAAAYTQVDRAEDEPELAQHINAQAPAAMAEAAREVGAWLVHFSTDYVFDGSGHTPWREQDACAPCNAYGHSKWLGEQAVRNSGARHLIFRTSWVFAAGHPNFARTMAQLAQSRDTLQVVNDQYGVPTYAPWLAQVVCAALPQAMAQGMQGVYHAAPEGQTNWCDYAAYVLQGAQQRAPQLPWRVQTPQPIASAAYPTRAKRPANSRLDCSLLHQSFGVQPVPWQRGVDAWLEAEYPTP